MPEHEEKPVNLGDVRITESGVDRSALAGLERWIEIRSGGCRERMIEQVDLVLAIHRMHARSDKELRTPAQIVDCLNTLFRDMSAVFARIRKLPPAIRLGLRLTYQGAIADNELERIERAMSAAVEKYKRTIVPHRPINDALRLTVQRLQTIFAEFCAKSLACRVRRRYEREFIHEALQLAGIEHPDPDQHRSRFNELLTRPKKERKSNAEDAARSEFPFRK